MVYFGWYLVNSHVQSICLKYQRSCILKYFGTFLVHPVMHQFFAITLKPNCHYYIALCHTTSLVLKKTLALIRENYYVVVWIRKFWNGKASKFVRQSYSKMGEQHEPLNLSPQLWPYFSIRKNGNTDWLVLGMDIVLFGIKKSYYN